MECLNHPAGNDRHGASEEGLEATDQEREDGYKYQGSEVDGLFGGDANSEGRLAELFRLGREARIFRQAAFLQRRDGDAARCEQRQADEIVDDG